MFKPDRLASDLHGEEWFISNRSKKSRSFLATLGYRALGTTFSGRPCGPEGFFRLHSSSSPLALAGWLRTAAP